MPGHYLLSSNLRSRHLFSHVLQSCWNHQGYDEVLTCRWPICFLTISLDWETDIFFKSPIKKWSSGLAEHEWCQRSMKWGTWTMRSRVYGVRRAQPRDIGQSRFSWSSEHLWDVATAAALLPGGKEAGETQQPCQGHREWSPDLVLPAVWPHGLSSTFVLLFGS